MDAENIWIVEVYVNRDLERILQNTRKLVKEREEKVEVYVNRDLERILQNTRKLVEEREEKMMTLIGKDFHARTEEDGGGWKGKGWGRFEEKPRRKSKDKNVNKKGKKLMEFLKELGWSIFNGGTKQNKEGKFIYSGSRGNTVIDNVIEDEEMKGSMVKMEIGDKVDSNHHLVEVTLDGG